MIIVPEIETVIILVPRTGSGSLRRAVAERYPRSMLLYRHMEADGVPHGYDRWRRLGVVRHPVERLWSLYKFLLSFGGDHSLEFINKMHRSVERPFWDWVLHNDVPFATPYDSAGEGRFWPQFTCLHPLPENRKSQFMYLRPDLGTEVWLYDDLPNLAKELDVDLDRGHNETRSAIMPSPSTDELAYIHRWFRWDIAMTGGEPYGGYEI